MDIDALLAEMIKAEDQVDAPTPREVLQFLIRLAQEVRTERTVTAARIASGFDDHPTIAEALRRQSRPR